MSQEYKHPESDKVVKGVKLEAGAILQATDLYASLTGEWIPIGSRFAAQAKPDGPLVVRPES
jgi:hypothetical protein